MQPIAPRHLPIIISAAYLALVALASVPIVTRPDSPLSGVLVFVLTVPWSLLLAILITVSKSSLMDSLKAELVVTAVAALINAATLFLLVRYASAKTLADGRRHQRGGSHASA